MRIVLITSVFMLLAGCGLPIAGVFTAGAAAYCAGVSEEGKQFLREAAGMPVRVISCHEVLGGK